MMTYEQGLRMARLMKDEDGKIRRAIKKVQDKQHGVVALKFADGCRKLHIEILDEPYDDNVRVYPG